MASEPFIDYKPTWEVVGSDELCSESPSDTVPEGVAVKQRGERGRDEKASKHSELQKQRQQSGSSLQVRSVVVVNISSALDGCDDQLLPATFRALESDLGFHPSLLGYITLSQTLYLSLFRPLWDCLADRHSRKWLLALATMPWGLITTDLGLVSEFWQVALLRALNGVCLESTGPVF
ncbi:transmembrane domain-containing protein [Cyclospora cayetanensis]|uniref:Transmembrane domain-containing protein n=1 Tax=Cyclospora cayetanensis TaxID=88456 RepID=A0A1D3CRI7_9EIME|nr:transmembrane domain-containing protein [Cyclospora cayetanensis]